MVAAAIVIQHAGRGTIFFFDEWDFITARRGFAPDSFLDGHNGHLSVLPVAAYKVMLQTVGLEAYWPYRLVLVAVHLTACALLFVAIRSRVGDAAAVCAAALLLFLGSAGDDLLWAFQIGFVGSIAAGLAMLISLDRRDRRGDLLATTLLGVTLACSSLGVPFLVAAVVELAVGRDWRRLARVTAGPVLLYVVWRLAYGESELRFANLDDAPSYAFGMLAAAVGGLTGLGSSAGPTLAVLVLIGLVWSVVRNAPGPRFLGALAGAAALWGLTALARAQFAEPEASRYVYASVVFIVLAIAELWPRGAELRGRVLVVAATVTAVAVTGNLLSLNQKAAGLRGVAENVKARLTALELVQDKAPPEFRPAPEGAPQIRAGAYVAAAGDFGSPADSESELAADSEPDRATADAVLMQLAAPAARPAPSNGVLRRCATVPAGGEITLRARETVVIAVPGSGPAVDLLARRFASETAGPPLARVEPGRRTLVTTEVDRISRPWVMRVTAAVRSCRM